MRGNKFNISINFRSNSILVIFKRAVGVLIFFLVTPWRLPDTETSNGLKIKLNTESI